MPPSMIKALILDMDGVLWRDETPIGNLSNIFDRIKILGLRVAFGTNNGTRTPEQYVKRLGEFGIHASPHQVVTSSIALAHILNKRFRYGSSVYVIGELGLHEALRDKGFEPIPVNETDNHVEACAFVMGIDRSITFKKIAEAALLVQQGIPFFATNSDLTYPTSRGEIPGTGAWVSIIVSATKIQPIYAGKPAPEILNLARLFLGTSIEETLVVGDRLSTDIAGGQAAGMPVSLVLSGVSSEEEGNHWLPRINFITKDLESLISML